MTNTIAPTTTEYKVTFHWTASDWDNSTNENGEYDYDNQPNETTECSVTLPTDATPWDVYCAADEVIGDAPNTDDSVYGWDGDGMCVEFNGKVLNISGDTIKHTTTWSDFH